MARKSWLYLILCASFLLLSPAANAKDGLFGLGARFAWENYRTPILIQVDDSLSDVSSLHKTNFGGDFQIRPIERLAISLALDMGFSKYSVRPYVSGSEPEISAKCFSFGFLLGLKFYVIEPKVKKAALYLKLDGGKYFAKIKNNASSLYPALAYQLSMLTDLASPLVFQFAIGAEFFAARSFSVGADVLGVRFSYSKGDTGSGDSATWTGDQKLLNFALYSALTLNFGFYKSDPSPAGMNKGASDGWGDSSGGGASAGVNAGWGTAPAPANDGWGAAPASSPAADNNGWGAAPAPPPPGADDGWGSSQTRQAVDDESPIKPNKKGKRSKAKSSSGGGESAPPPPPPGY